MRTYDSDTLRELADDIELELTKLSQLAEQIGRVAHEIRQEPTYADLFYESLALKFHNFYTGCERIFSLISNELNGGSAEGTDWHRRLLARMAAPRGDRKAVITDETARHLQEFLAFRHVVRNIYGFELDVERMALLIQKYPLAWSRFDLDIRAFMAWLRELAVSLDDAL